MLQTETLDYRFGTFANITIRALEDVKEELTALRMMELQDCTVLDQLTAASGGVCALVGTFCCTFIPENDADGGIIQQAIVNLTALRMAVDGDHVNKVDWLSWMTSGPWYHILLKFLTPVATVLLLFCVFISCILQCLRLMITHAVSNSVRDALLQEHREVYLKLLEQAENMDTAV
ncbi:syncytin-2-like [Xyrichtys novacula]|uniref:Syncytin-2-like n=1 Tax=Xyrichtys novacula TaxID=13765 RepID=A0AAV1G1Q8_XYRNO|nr:syncytin-2-like [Xyrichtys novacula]